MQTVQVVHENYIRFPKKFQLKFDGPPVHNKLDLNNLNIYNGVNGQGIRDAWMANLLKPLLFKNQFFRIIMIKFKGNKTERNVSNSPQREKY